MTTPPTVTPPESATASDESSAGDGARDREHGGAASAEPGRRRVWVRRLIAVVGVIVAVVMIYVGVTFVQVWRASTRDDIERSDAIVVLGAAQYDGRPSPVLEARLQHALELYEKGIASRIVVTGGRQEGDTFTEATSGYNWLRERGVPDEAILKEVQGRNTYESLAATARFLRSRDLDEVVLVSDGYHALRVEGTAREVGLDPHVSTVDAGGASLPELGKETIAVAIGRITGYRRLTRLTG